MFISIYIEDERSNLGEFRFGVFGWHKTCIIKFSSYALIGISLEARGWSGMIAFIGASFAGLALNGGVA